MIGLSYSQKKYLFAIYKLCQSDGEAKSSEVAKIVGVSRASTAAMAVKLCENGYIKLAEHILKRNCRNKFKRPAYRIYNSSDHCRAWIFGRRNKGKMIPPKNNVTAILNLFKH